MREKDSFALAVQTMRLREKKRRLRLLAGRALLMLFIAWLLSFVFGIFVVQGDSMRPAYQDGDLVFMIRVLPKGVTYDNVVILEDAEGKEILKRIVGLPGDTIRHLFKSPLAISSLMNRPVMIVLPAPGSSAST